MAKELLRARRARTQTARSCDDWTAEDGAQHNLAVVQRVWSSLVYSHVTGHRTSVRALHAVKVEPAIGIPNRTHPLDTKAAPDVAVLQWEKMAAKRLLAQQLRLLAQRSVARLPAKLPNLAQAAERAPAMERSSQTVSRAVLAMADCIVDKLGGLGFHRSLTIDWPQHA